MLDTENGNTATSPSGTVLNDHLAELSSSSSEEDDLVERLKQQSLSPACPVAKAGIVIEPVAPPYSTVSTINSPSSNNNYERVSRDSNGNGGRILVTTPIEICV